MLVCHADGLVIAELITIVVEVDNVRRLGP
jgi:hypothetical protein